MGTFRDSSQEEGLVVKASKLFERLAAAPRRPLPFRDFERCLLAAGFVCVRTSGSHKVYEHAAAARPLIVQPRGKDAKPYQQQEFLDMMEQYGLSKPQ
ncbi:MAG TPA: type II toxin-antitoxin system HicA family toxin [Allosphingosinicella sp.]